MRIPSYLIHRAHSIVCISLCTFHLIHSIVQWTEEGGGKRRTWGGWRGALILKSALTGVHQLGVYQVSIGLYLCSRLLDFSFC